MAPWKKDYEKARRFQPYWEYEFPWLEKRGSDTSYRAFCKICSSEVQPRKSHFVTHGKSKKHMNKAKLYQSILDVEGFKPNVKYVSVKKDHELFEASDNENALENPVLVEIMSNTDDAIKNSRNKTHTKRRTEELVSYRTMVQNTPQKNQELEPEDHLGAWIATNLKTLKRDPELYLSTEMNLFATMIKSLTQLTKKDADSNRNDPSSEGDIVLESLNATDNFF